MKENPGADARRKYDDEAFLDAVRKKQPASTKEVGEEVECSRRVADYRLRKLQNEDQINSKMVGNSLIWFISDDKKSPS